jgi:hypothetical protein
LLHLANCGEGARLPEQRNSRVALLGIEPTPEGHGVPRGLQCIVCTAEREMGTRQVERNIRQIPPLVDCGARLKLAPGLRQQFAIRRQCRLRQYDRRPFPALVSLLRLTLRQQGAGMPKRRESGLPVLRIELFPELVGLRRCNHGLACASQCQLCTGQIDEQIRVIGRTVRVQLIEQHVGSLQRGNCMGGVTRGELRRAEGRECHGSLAGRSGFDEQSLCLSQERHGLFVPRLSAA